jgi:ATP-dependent protease ClpP protease subunit
MMRELDALLAAGAARPRPPVPPTMAARWNLDAAAETSGTTHLYLYDRIGGFFGIAAGDVIAQLRAVSGHHVRVHLNSPGGDVFDGLAIYNSLRQHPGGVEVQVEGLAASIASVIAMAGERLTMAAASLLMIHDPHGVVIGGAEDMRQMAALMDKAGGLLADVYAGRGGATRDAIREWMQAETWFTPQEALDAGLIDAIDEAALPAAAVAARATFDLSGFRRPPTLPAAAAVPAPSPPPRSREHARTLTHAYELVIGARCA